MSTPGKVQEPHAIRRQAQPPTAAAGAPSYRPTHHPIGRPTSTQHTQRTPHTAHTAHTAHLWLSTRGAMRSRSSVVARVRPSKATNARTALLIVMSPRTPSMSRKEHSSLRGGGRRGVGGGGQRGRDSDREAWRRWRGEWEEGPLPAPTRAPGAGARRQHSAPPPPPAAAPGITLPPPESARLAGCAVPDFELQVPCDLHLGQPRPRRLQLGPQRLLVGLHCRQESSEGGGGRRGTGTGSVENSDETATGAIPSRLHHNRAIHCPPPCPRPHKHPPYPPPPPHAPLPANLTWSAS